MKPLLIACLALASCRPEVESSHQSSDGFDYTVVRIDGCQYLKRGNDFTHKGNCDAACHHQPTPEKP